MPVRIPARIAALLAGCCLLCAPLARAEQKEDACVTVIYPVADLVVRPCKLAPGKSGEAGKNPVAQSTEQELMDLVEQCHPESWSDVGGRGTLRYHPLGKALVVTQSARIQKEVAALLQRLRLEVCLEVKLLAVPESYLERLGTEFHLQTGLAQGKIEISFLTNSESSRLAQQVQADRRVSLMQMPRLTLFNGQPGDVKIVDHAPVLTKIEKVTRGDQVFLVPVREEEEFGVWLKVKPVVSADCRFVRVEFEFEKSDVGLEPAAVRMPAESPAAARYFGMQPTRNTQRIHSVLNIPDGGTAVFCGLEGSPQQELPVLGGKTPYVGRLFRNSPHSGEPRKLLVLVTPRILEGEEPVPAPPLVEERVPPPACPDAAAGTPVHQAHLECAPPPAAPQAMPSCMPKGSGHADLVKELLRAYNEAAAAGQAAEAARLARAALILDPFCFQKR